MHAVEAEAQQVLDLLGVAPSLPARRLVGAGYARQPRDGYEIAILIDGADLARSAQRRACHHPSMWRMWVLTEARFSRARV